MKDGAGIVELADRGLTVLLKRGTEVLVLEVEPTDKKSPVRPPCAVVRVTGGPHAGRKLWIGRYYVNRMIPNAYFKPKPGSVPGKPAGTADWASRALATAKGLEAAGKVAAAVTTYKRIVKEAPDTPEAAKAAARLKVLAPG